MTRRALRRQYAILGVLHDHGPQYALDLCRLLRLGSGSIYPDLATLEHENRIIGEWIEQGGDRPRRRRYRVTTPDERDQARKAAAWYVAERQRLTAERRRWIRDTFPELAP